jgi:dTDP-4-dehydrorhamnose reductase
MLVLITGANGQIGRELQALQSEFPSIQFIPVDRATLDLTQSAEVERFLNETTFDACINCAAYTAVDKAEQEQELAYSINADAAEQLAKICQAKGAAFIHYSSDYVYNNGLDRPLLETDPTTPQSVYAQSKLAGDLRVMAAHQEALVFRTSWVYSSFGHNFVKTMFRLGKERDLLRIVNDQIGTPTYARDIARMTLQLLLRGWPVNQGGIYNYSNEGVCSWYDFTKAIFDLNGIGCKVEPIPSSEYPTPAARPHFSVLNKSKIKSAFGLDIPYWRDSLLECLELLNHIN